VAVQLQFGIGILALAEQVRPLRHELQGQRRADDRLAARLRHRADHVRVAETGMAERAGHRRGADILQRIDDVLVRTLELGDLGLNRRHIEIPLTF